MKLERTVQADSLKRVLEALANSLTPDDNFRMKLLGPVTTPAANVEFTVTHSLGTTPKYYIWNVDAAGTVYDSRRANWTASLMYLKCSVAGAALYLLVM